jgi:hypothetical protein
MDSSYLIFSDVFDAGNDAGEANGRPILRKVKAY